MAGDIRMDSVITSSCAMPRADTKPKCPTLSMMRLLGKKWTVPVLEELYFSGNKVSFNDLQSSVGGITPRNLSKCLKDLYATSVISKGERWEGNVLHTEYALTKKGEAVAGVIKKAKEVGICWYGMNSYCKYIKCSACNVFGKPSAKSS